MIPLVATIAAATAAGFALEHRLGERADEISKGLVRLMLWVIGPPVVFFNIVALELSAEVGAGISYGFAALFLCLVLAYLVGTRLLHLTRPRVGALMVGCFGNTGYLGLPFVAALLGLDALPEAVAYDVAVTTCAIFTIGFSIGAAFGTVADRPREKIIAFFANNPLLWACAAGFAAPAALAPDAAVDAAQIGVYALLPLGFFVVGVTLASEAEEGAIKFPPPLTLAVSVGLFLKLLVAPLVVIGLSAVLIEVPDTYPAQAAMASAINGIVVAHIYGLDRQLVASMIAWSTAVVALAGLLAALL